MKYESRNIREAESIQNHSSDNLGEDIFRRIVESAPNAIVLVDSTGSIVLVNTQTEKLFGYNRKELINNSVELLVPARYTENHSKYMESFFKHPATRAMSTRRDLYGKRKDGIEIPVEIGLNPIQSEKGTFILCSIIDITERKRAEEKFRRVVEATPNAIVVVGKDGKIILVNAETERLFGYTRTELIGEYVEILIPTPYKTNHAEYLSNYFVNPTARSMGAGTELFGLRKDGVKIPVEIGLNPIGSEEGTQTLASIIDITERKKRIEQKKAEEELAEQRARELERLAELERFQKLTIGRELKMIELKKTVSELKAKLEKLEKDDVEF